MELSKTQLRKDEAAIYTDIDTAREEIWRRWNSADLRKKVEAYMGEVPFVFQSEPRSVLDRNVITPNNEFTHFLKLAGQVNLRPLGWEYQDDKFCSKNADKLGLAKMAFFHKRNKRGETIFNYVMVADCSLVDGKPFSRIKTLWGEDFVSFHHRLLAENSPIIDVADGSGWYKSNGKRASKYYLYFLSLFICHGVLFENFVTSEEEEEERFSKKVVFPAFKQVVDHFGLKPLIVPLAPHKAAADIYWRCYPAHIENDIARYLCESPIE